jgi:predicted transcriptional regulator
MMDPIEPLARRSDAPRDRGAKLTPKTVDVTPQWCHYGDMEIGHFVNDLQRHLVDSVENGADETRAVAERLVANLDSAARLMVLDVLSAAVGEITRDLAPGSVDMRLRGREVEFVVAQPNPESDADDLPAASVEFDDSSTSRTTLRLPDALKARVDDAAAADGLSVNTWLVRAVAAALQPKQRRSAQRALRTGDNFAGWAR